MNKAQQAERRFNEKLAKGLEMDEPHLYQDTINTYISSVISVNIFNYSIRFNDGSVFMICPCPSSQHGFTVVARSEP